MSRMQDIESRHELAIGQQIVDPRPIGQKFAEWLSVASNLLLVVTPVAIVTAAAPPVAVITLPFLLFATLAHVTTKSLLPIRYPRDAVDEKGAKGDGILFVGSISSSSPYEKFKEIWLADDDLRMHMLILGSTGSGKSEALKSIFYNALLWSSGFFIADGKADNKLPTDVYTMARSLGRDQDVLFLNFLLGGKTPEQVRRSRRRRTNKLNPFSSSDADTIIQMGSNLLPRVEGDAKNWQEKALNLWRSVVAALCYKRDTKGFNLSVATFIDYMSLDKVEELYMEGYMEAQARGGEWSYGFVGVKSYLESGCPAYQVSKLLKRHGWADDGPSEMARQTSGGRRGSGKDTEQDSMAFEQHSYRTNQLMPVLNLLDKTYGFIFRDKYPEIDMSDVTLRNRILVMLIPSLEKSAAEAENLGKLAIACLRVMMSKNLGAELEGSYEELLGSKATNSPYPYVVALDELAYYFSDGIAVMFAQARSLGTCMIAAAQDLEKLTEGTKAAEAGAMLANQVIKFFLRIDDTGKTADMVQKVVGKVTVAARRSFRVGDFGYSRKGDVDVVEVDRVSPQRLKKFKKGEGIVDAGGKTHFMNWFYMGKDIEMHRPADGYFVNRFLQVETPTQEEIAAHSITADEVNDPFNKGQELLRMLRQDTQVQMRTPYDPVLQRVGEVAQRLSPHLAAETRAIALYVAAKQALQGEATSETGAVGGGGRGAQSHKQAPLQGGHDGFGDALTSAATSAGSAIVLEDGGIDGAGQAEEAMLVDDDDPLAFLRSSPFERKPAQDVLGLGTDKEVVPAPMRERERVNAILADPFDAVMDHGQTMSLGEEIRFGGHLMSQLVGAPDAVDPDTGLSLIPKDDWIGDALEQMEQMVAVPRSSDNTVVGLNAPTLDRVEQVEKLMDSPRPAAAAKALERVVAVRVTAQTAPSEPADPQSLDDFFSALSDRLNR